MSFVFIGKNESKIRHNILRGVYEENLFMLSKGRPALSRRGSFPLKKILLSAVLCVLAVLIHGQYTGSSFAPAEPTANTRILLASLPEPAGPPRIGVSPLHPIPRRTSQQSQPRI